MRSAALGILLAGFGAFAPAAARADLSKDLEVIYAKISLAIIHKDADAAAKYLAPDFTIRMTNRHVLTRDQFLHQFPGNTSGISVTSRTRKVVGATSKRSEVIAMVKGSSTQQSKGIDGKTHTIVIDQDLRDVWVKQSGRWLLETSDVLKQHLTMDGHRVEIPKK